MSHLPLFLLFVTTHILEVKTWMRHILDHFLNRDAIVERDKETVKGKLVYFKPSIRGNPHSSYILILKVDNRMVILRSWDLTKRG
jgi:hypothetical protein